MLESRAMPENVLYLAVLPLIRIPVNILAVRANVVRHSGAEQILTLFPNRDFAAQFFPDEVEFYIQAFLSVEQSLIGGHVLGYEIIKEGADDGRVIVKVVQHVG